MKRQEGEGFRGKKVLDLEVEEGKHYTGDKLKKAQEGRNPEWAREGGPGIVKWERITVHLHEYTGTLSH